MGSGDSGLFLKPWVLLRHRGPGHFLPPEGSWLGSHTNDVCTRRTPSGKGEEEGRSPPASLSTAVHSQKSEEQDCTLRMGLPSMNSPYTSARSSRELRSGKAKYAKPRARRSGSARTSDSPPSPRPIVPPRVLLQRPPPAQPDEAGPSTRPSLTHQNAHLLLAKEAREERGDGEAHSGGALATCSGLLGSDSRPAGARKRRG